MKIKLINFGGLFPKRAHYNDAGADVFANSEITVGPGQIGKVPVGFGIILPDGFVGLVLPRSGMTTNNGISAEPVPIDSGYTGEIHAILHNTNDYSITIKKNTKVAQLVIVPTVLADFVLDDSNLEKRGTGGFGSTGNY